MAGFGSNRIGSFKISNDVIYVADNTERDALTSVKDGQVVLVVAGNELFSWDEGSSTWITFVGTLTPTSVSDTNTVDHTVAAGVLSSDLIYQDSNTVNLSDDASGIKADVSYQDSNSINLSDDAGGLKADMITQNSNTASLSVDASGLKADVNYQDSTTINFSDDGSGLKAETIDSGIDHDSLNNTHNLSTDIDHNGLTNTHNLTSDIDHDGITNTHNLTTDIDHTAISNIGSNSHSDIDTHIGSSLNPHSVTKDQVLSGDLIDNDDVDASAAIAESKLNLEYGTSALNTAIGNRTYTEDNYVVDSESVTSSIDSLDQQVKDNADDIAGKQADVVTTRGDVIIGNSSNVASRLAVGSADQVLYSDGTDVSWQDAAGGSEIKETESTHGFAVFDAIYHDGSNWTKAQADAEATVATHVVKEVVDTNTFKAIQFGRITSTAHGLTPGDYHWLSTSSAGDSVTTEPSTGYSCPLFYVLDANNVIALVYRPAKIDNDIPYRDDVVYLKDIKSSGTNGGDFSSGDWRTRDLNTTENTQTWCSLSSNQFTLSAGKYKIYASAPAKSVVLHKAKLRNITDSTDDIIATSSVSADSDNTSSTTTLTGVISITASKTFEIQHYCSTTKSGNGFGSANSFSVSEVYTQVEIEKIGS